ncbi:MAG: esterase-like activity of phytase family protein [Proteobacteria bacterium]|nr:esterase-like activity of phytase family protein [Pseudomonadota bacterium]
MLVVAACAASPPSTPVNARSLAFDIQAQKEPFKLDDPSARQVGRLIWRGGLSLKANSANFGGWSDLYVTPDGRHLTSISDVGGWFTATIDYDQDGNLAGLHEGRIGPLHRLDGKPLVTKEWADSEAMAHMPDGSWMVSFERHHRIWHYPTLEGVPTAIDLPTDFSRQPSNGGVETLTALPDGRLIAISEKYSVRPGFNAGWIGTPAGEGRYAWSRFEYATVPDFHPTAIVQLPDGSFAMLERAFDMVRGVRVRVMHFEADQLKPGGTVHAEELAFLVTPYAVDNLEGIAAAKGPHGETLLWLISDDNFNPLQRNLLLMFEIAK